MFVYKDNDTAKTNHFLLSKLYEFFVFNLLILILNHITLEFSPVLFDIIQLLQISILIKDPQLETMSTELN